MLTLRKGVVLSLSCKWKLNSKSSIEAEIIGVDDAMNFVLWVNLFVKEQIKGVAQRSILKTIGGKTIIQQDNTSSI